MSSICTAMALGVVGANACARRCLRPHDQGHVTATGPDIEFAGQVDVGKANLAGRAHHRRQEVGCAYEIGDEGAARRAIDLAGRADLHDHAAVHHQDAVGHRQGLFLVVGDHDGGHLRR